MSNREIGLIPKTILDVRGKRVILDHDLACLYGVATKRLNEQVKRNSARFPEDFMFRLTQEETVEINRSQNATTSQKHRNPLFPPHAFTEFGAIQAANVVNSERAIEMGVHVVRAFVRLRELLATNADLVRQLETLERKYQGHDKQIAVMLAALRQLMNPSARASRGIGFTADL
jgi:hypothetical protein